MFKPVEVETAFSRLVRSRLARVEASYPRKKFAIGDRSTYVRSSSLGYICGRFEALRIVHDLITTKEVSAESVYNMAKGTGYHSMHQEEIIPAVASDMMLGWWRGANATLAGRHPDGKPILYSRKEAEAKIGAVHGYVEVDLVDHKLGLSGHPDMIFDWSRLGGTLTGAPDGLEIQELKTRADNNYMWGAVNAESGGSPLAEHVHQVQSYMMMSEIPWSRIVYIRKSDDQGKRALAETYSEFRVHEDKAAQSKIVAYVEGVHEVVERAYAGQIPVRTKCSDPNKGAAKSCPLRDLCFTGKFAPSPVAVKRESYEASVENIVSSAGFL